MSQAHFYSGMINPKSIRALVVLCVANTAVSLLVGYVLQTSFAVIWIDLLFAEGGILLVAGGVVGIFALSPTLNKVRDHFDGQKESPQDASSSPQGDRAKPNETQKRSMAVDRSSLRIVVWGVLLLVIATAFSLAFV